MSWLNSCFLFTYDISFRECKVSQVACDLTTGELGVPHPAGSLSPQEEEEREKLILKKYKATILEIDFVRLQKTSSMVWCAYLHTKFRPNVGRYNIHGASGVNSKSSTFFDPWKGTKFIMQKITTIGASKIQFTPFVDGNSKLPGRWKSQEFQGVFIFRLQIFCLCCGEKLLVSMWSRLDWNYLSHEKKT